MAAPLLPLTASQQALVLQFEPVGRMVAASAFKRCKGYSDRLGLEGQALLGYLQAEAIAALTEAAARFNPLRIGQDSGKPVSFAPYARSKAKWAVHHTVRGGRRPGPWTQELDDRAIEAAGAAEEHDVAEDLARAEREHRVGAAVRRLPPHLQRAADRAARGLLLPEEELAALRRRLRHLKPEENDMAVKHPIETRRDALARLAKGETATDVAAALDVPRNTVRAWQAAASATKATPPPRPAAAVADFPPPATEVVAPLVLELSPSSKDIPAHRPRRPRGVPVAVVLELAGVGRVTIPGTICRVVYSGPLP